MVKKYLLVISILGTLLFSSCTKPAVAGEPLNLASEDMVLDEYLHVNLPQLERENQRVYYVNWGKLTESSYEDSVYILSDAQYVDTYQNTIYMIADIEGSKLIQEIGKFDKMVIQNGILSLNDIDGDNIDEIIVHFEISGNGGTITRIYKVENGMIVLLSNLDEFDTGFVSEYEEGYKLHIFNKYTDYSQVFDISNWFSAEFFDENGMSVVKEDIFVRPFSSCEVKDSNKDGKYEMHCSQEVSLAGYIGRAYTVLQYNEVTGNFNVVESNFLPK